MNRDQSVEFARTYVADLLSFFGVNVSVEASVQDDVIELSVPSTDINSLLIGRGAETLRSLQFLVSTVLRNKDAALSRVNLDIAKIHQNNSLDYPKTISKSVTSMKYLSFHEANSDSNMQTSKIRNNLL